MRHATRDAVAMLLLCAALAFWRIAVFPELSADPRPIDWRFNLVWMIPLLVTAFAPWIFHPYIVGGRDLPRRRTRAPIRTDPTPQLAPHETRTWAAPRRRGAA